MDSIDLLENDYRGCMLKKKEKKKKELMAS